MESAHDAGVFLFLSRGMQAVASSQDFLSGESRYAGAMVLHVGLGQLGLWWVFWCKPWSASGAEPACCQAGGGHHRFGLCVALEVDRRIQDGLETGTLECCWACLLFPQCRRWKRRFALWPRALQPELVMRKLLEAFVELEPVWEGAYYVDGHFCPYSGSRPLTKGWKCQAACGGTGTDRCLCARCHGKGLVFHQSSLERSPFARPAENPRRDRVGGQGSEDSAYL